MQEQVLKNTEDDKGSEPLTAFQGLAEGAKGKDHLTGERQATPMGFFFNALRCFPALAGVRYLHKAVLLGSLHFPIAPSKRQPSRLCWVEQDPAALEATNMEHNEKAQSGGTGSLLSK